MKLIYMGKDSWSRPVYKCDNTLFVDVAPTSHTSPNLCTKSSNCFDGEPDTPIEYLEKYKGEELEFVPKRVVWYCGD